MRKTTALSLIFVFLLPILIGFSSIKTPFTLIDDGEILLTSKAFIQKFQQGDYLYLFKNEPQNGRIRPVFWLVNALPYIVSGQNPQAYHILHLVFYVLSSVLIFKIIFDLTQSNFAGIMGALGYTLAASTSEIWNRLGPQEPIMNTLLLFAIYFIERIARKSDEKADGYKKDVLVSLLLTLFFLFLATFTKETVAAVIPALFFFIFVSVITIRKFTIFIQTLIIITLGQIFFTLGLFFLKNYFNINGWYSTQLTFVKQELINNFDRYMFFIQKDTGYFLPLSLLILVIFLIRKSKDLRRKTHVQLSFYLFFLCLSACLLIAQLPWIYPLSRYLPPVFLGLFLFIGCTIGYLASLLRRMKKSPVGHIKVIGHLGTFALIFYSLIFFYFQGKEILKEIEDGKQRAQTHSEMVKRLSDNLQKENKVYMVIYEGAFEYGYETGLHLNLFYNKNNSVERINPYSMPPFKNGDIVVVSRQYQEIPDSMLSQILSRKSLITNNYLWSLYKIEQ